MLNLIPRDYWEHNLADLVSALANSASRDKNPEFIEIPGVGSCVPMRSGRAAVVSLLKALKLPRGSRVGVPLYCCPVVFDAVAAAGSTIRFMDIEESSFCLSADDVAAKRSQVDVLIAVHMFGNMCEMPKILEAAVRIPVLEDCAQALGSRLNGQAAGSFGTAAFFSFRSAKYISAGEGGAIFTRDLGLRASVVALTKQMGAPSSLQEGRHALVGYIKALLRSRPLYGAFGYALWRCRGMRNECSMKPEVVLGRIRSSDRSIVLKRLPRLDSAVELQRNNAAFYCDKLDLAPGMVCREESGAFYNRYLFPLTFRSHLQRDWMAEYLRRLRIDSMKYLDGVLRVAADRYGYGGDCPVAEALCSRVLAVPVYHGLSTKDVKHVACSVSRGWAEMVRRQI